MEPGLRGNAKLGVAMHPLRVVGCKHVCFDAERGQILRELERALDATAS